MEQVLFRLHVRFITVVTTFLSQTSRNIVERSLLLASIIALSLLGLLHFTYSSTLFFQSNCLSQQMLASEPSFNNSLQVEVLGIHLTNSASQKIMPQNDTCTQIIPNKVKLGNMKFWEKFESFLLLQDINLGFSGYLEPNATRTYLFSNVKGYLVLPSDVIECKNISRLDIELYTHDSCFGPITSAFLLRSIVGYDTVVKNWMIRSFGGHGFLKNTLTQEIFDLNLAADFVARTGNAGSTGILKKGSNNFDGMEHYVAFKIGVILMTLFLFFTCTTLVSFTLRVTQERMLKFTFLLNYNITHRIPYGYLVLAHLAESLVFVPLMIGVLFFLIEFFLDQFLAFLVLSVVWAAEVYSVVSLRTATSLRYFPRVFFLYFSLWHVYFFSFPFGFSYPALAVTVLFLLHAMFCFWNRFEIPAFQAGTITALQPRHGLRVDSSPMAIRLTQARRSRGGRRTSEGALQIRRPSFHAPSPRRLTGAPPPFPTTPGVGSSVSERTRFGTSSSPPSLDPSPPRTTILSYSRHVELSRQIQERQMAAIMAPQWSAIPGQVMSPINLNSGVGLDLDELMYPGEGNSLISTSAATDEFRLTAPRLIGDFQPRTQSDDALENFRNQTSFL